jgi:hypothetical protein
MSDPDATRIRCLWRADDGFCASCKAKRFRHDALGMNVGYDTCIPENDYPSCEFYKERPVPPGKK